MSEQPDLTQLPYVSLAGALLSGPAGFELFELLCAEFPTIGRRDVFLGVSTAIALIRADLLVAEMEARGLRLQLQHQEAA